jgi:hypothetical protein
VDAGTYSPIIPPSLAKGFQIEILAKIELTSTDERKTGKRRCNEPLIIVDRGYGGYMHRIGLEII